MKHFIKVVATTALSTVCIAAFATGSIVGPWKGKISIDTAHMPAPKTPQQAQQVAKLKARVESMVLNFNFNKDHTFTESDPMSKKAHNGSWSVKGSQVLITEGKGPNGAKTFTLSKDSRTMILKSATVTFTLHKA